MINLSRDTAVAAFLEGNAMIFIFTLIVDKNFPLADWASMLLSNISKRESAVTTILSMKLNNKSVMEILMDIFCLSRNYNSNADFHFLASVFADITRIGEGRLFFVENNAKFLHDLLPFTVHENLIRKGGSISAIKQANSY